MSFDIRKLLESMGRSGKDLGDSIAFANLAIIGCKGDETAALTAAMGATVLLACSSSDAEALMAIVIESMSMALKKLIENRRSTAGSVLS